MKILEVAVALDGGGIDRYLYNYCTHIHGIHFDYCVVDIGNGKGMLEPLLEASGSMIYRVPRISSNPLAYYKVIKAHMKKEKYDAVHVHLGYKGFLALAAARHCGIKTRIVHAHIASSPEAMMHRILRKICAALTMANATHLAACGIDAAKWIWGEKNYENGRVQIVNNAIEIKQYAFSAETRDRVREQLRIPVDTFVVGNVGRLTDQKNPMRILEIFAKISAMNPNSILLLIGRGEMENEIIDRAEKQGIAKDVKILGVRNDVSELLNAMDVFLFPSKYEGLPFAIIEAQCNGLNCLCSDVITPLVKVTDLVTFLSLNEADEKWAEVAIQFAPKGHSMQASYEVAEAGYDIDIEAKKMEAYYKRCITR